MLGSTVSEIQVDQALIGNPLSFKHLFEILDCILVQPNRDLLLQLCSVRVGLGISDQI